MKTKIAFLIFIFFLLQIKAFASISDYLTSFYCDYLKERRVSNDDREILNLLYKISSEKTADIEIFIQNAKTYEDKRYGIFTFDEEYKDFLENINFELNYVPNCPLKKRAKRKFKKAHKKYMRRLEKYYLK